MSELTFGERVGYERRIVALLEALCGLSGGTSHLDDPALRGNVMCWCAPRGMFARGPHDDACVAARAALNATDLNKVKQPHCAVCEPRDLSDPEGYHCSRCSDSFVTREGREIHQNLEHGMIACEHDGLHCECGHEFVGGDIGHQLLAEHREGAHLPDPDFSKQEGE